jgi:hypothetical protein
MSDIKVDTKGLNKLQLAAAQAKIAWMEAQAFALANHSAYKAALTTNKTARVAYEEVQEKADKIIGQLAGEPDTDQDWFDPAWVTGPVWLRNNALANLKELAEGHQALMQDLAAHFTIEVHEAEADPETAAIDADVAAKAPNPGLVFNPNTQSPQDQSNKHPPVETPPVDADDGPGWGTVALLVAGVALIVKLVVR